MRVFFLDGSVVEYVAGVRADWDQESNRIVIDDADGNRIAELARGEVDRWEPIPLIP